MKSITQEEKLIDMLITTIDSDIDGADKWRKASLVLDKMRANYGKQHGAKVFNTNNVVEASQGNVSLAGGREGLTAINFKR